MKAALLANEADRLKALAEYHLLESVPEQAFDDLTQLAAQICGCPMALVTVIDEKRQWFKSRLGVDMHETPREHSFCAHAIQEPERLLIVDAIEKTSVGKINKRALRERYQPD